MTKNIGTVDRIVRVVLGIFLLAIPFIGGLALFESDIATAIAVIAGIVMLATASMRFCPMYRIFGIKTCKM